MSKNRSQNRFMTYNTTICELDCASSTLITCDSGTSIRYLSDIPSSFFIILSRHHLWYNIRLGSISYKHLQSIVPRRYMPLYTIPQIGTLILPTTPCITCLSSAMLFDLHVVHGFTICIIESI